VTAPSYDPFRLPRTALPSRYDLVLEPDLATATFTGEVTIAIDVAQQVGELVLNANELDVHAATVNGADATFRLDAESERLFVVPAEPLQPGPATLYLTFSGSINDKLRGFYRSTYKDDAGVEHVIATTQMQPTDCRRAFPCWDEPDFKAIFGITLVVDDGLVAISNGPETGRTVHHSEGGRKFAVSFADTMTMSTYLVAFIVGPLEATEAIDVDGVPMRLVHVPGKAPLTGFGLEVGAASLRWFTDFYGIRYADRKIDLVALPDFAAGAMENTGCITFREHLLLVDPANSTQVEQELVADVVSHELAHMWFGNLVTMRWWNGIWLNEAFATFMEIAAVDAFRPDWQRWTTFSLDRSVAFETDSLAATRPVEYEVRSPADSEGMFDVLTYQKGGALLRMLQQYLGEEAFRDGVRHYLATHAYGNTETGDLWDAIEHVVVERGGTEPVRAMMDSWIWQPGFPLVTAAIDRGELVLRQQRFAFDPAAADATLWYVPVHVRVGDDEQVVMLEKDELRLPLADASAPIVVNANGHGFYRVGYSDELLARLTGPALTSLSTVERYNLVDDAWNAVVAGRLDAIELWSFLQGFASERELPVWQAITAALRGLTRLVDGPALDALRAGIAGLARPALDELGWERSEGESDLTSKLRGLLVTTVAVLGGDHAVAARCAEVLADRDGADPELVAAATTAVAAHGTEADYERFLTGFREAATPQEMLRNLYALAEFESPELLQRTLDLAVSGEVKTQNAPFLLNRCIANRTNGEMAWRFVREQWQHANEHFPVNTIVRMIDTVKLLNTPSAETDVAGFFAEHAIPQATKTLEQVLERQHVNVALRQRAEPALTSALA
jgi:puromycin-sensitive aminopeptidase